MIEIPDKDEIERHYAAMRGGDDQLSYTETGDMVIPPEVQQANPALMLAAIQTFQALGANPNQYVSGSMEGSYNPDTGVQEFAWYDDLLTKAGEYSTKAMDYVTNTDMGKALATGALTAGASKLAGLDTTQALAMGAGAGLGYAASDKIATGFNNLDAGKGFFDPKVQQPKVTSTGFLDATKKAAMSLNPMALSGAALGAYSGYQMSQDPLKGINLNLSPADTTPLNLQPLAKPMEPFNTDDADKPNLSATLPQNLPIAPMTPQGLKGVGGISYKKKVKDRDTGRFKYVDDDNDASAFSRAINNKSRRKGFGGAIMVI
jgi:hypothetical protein